MNGKRNLPEGISVMSLRLSTTLHDQLRAAAKANDRTVSQEARRAIASYLEREGAAA